MDAVVGIYRTGNHRFHFARKLLRLWSQTGKVDGIVNNTKYTRPCLCTWKIPWSLRARVFVGLINLKGATVVGRCAAGVLRPRRSQGLFLESIFTDQEHP